jgi:ketosteroid isomerase-like protein
MSTSLDTFKQYYENFDQGTIDGLDDVYAEDVVFVDPLHVITGRNSLKEYFRSMCANLTECRFEFIDEVINGGNACFKWEMHYRHPSIKGNKPLKLAGASFIEYSDKIDSHEDYYDMGAMLYEHVPVLGSTIRIIKSRIAK